MEKTDPLVQKIAEEACLDPQYVEMMNYVETGTNYKDIDPECELRKMDNVMDRLSIVTLDGYGTRVIVKDETCILVPRGMRKQMTDILHFSHAADRTMLTQCKNKIFWPGIAKTLQDRYADCEKCQQHKASQATPHTTVSGEDLFSNFMPGQRI